ncbi:hypothetical protein FLO80_19135 [Aquicoccus porphyridii]|uniref:Class I SAM-dependent methyltransferase n=1 Tax=Aquicoccus porphyridii TaxID=1852029 RepID=A0A5A9YYN6_9RHOB|nr:hypothetical protein [Aquicoccus porphyridii]KAA0909969.1 hypothetical protein FLO80_19135 [Aquicoccus porphyridii]
MVLGKRMVRYVRGTSSLPPARAARVWSNSEIAFIAPYVTGDVVNVSAWEDQDKEGRHYRDYFSSADSYETTNFEGWRGAGVRADHVVDLQSAAPDDLLDRYDLVFNHTTLEHIFDIHQAFRTMGSMSRDAMLVIVPFMQHLHGPEDGDFWRPSPYAMRRLHKESGLTVLREAAGPKGGKVRYLSYFSSKKPDRWKDSGIESKGDCEAILRDPL